MFVAGVVGLGLSEVWGLNLSLGTRTRGAHAAVARSTFVFNSWGTGPMHRGRNVSLIPAAQHQNDRRWWVEWRSSPGSLSLWLPLWVLPIPLGAWAALAWRSRAPVGPACRACGYSLQGVGKGVCPECGEECKPGNG
ncbi:hypothetical protein PHYC_03816 [Phycisphaerales bacterium]|nr:hypothetical protein PHYC_03816 [Phycisphaerales bacterium]